MITVSIGGKNRPFKFGFNAIDIFCKERNISLEQFNELFAKMGAGSSSIGDLRDIVFAGLAGGALSAGDKMDFTSYQVGDWMDELKQGELSKMVEAAAGSLHAGKKKVIPTKEKVVGRKP